MSAPPTPGGTHVRRNTPTRTWASTGPPRLRTGTAGACAGWRVEVGQVGWGASHPMSDVALSPRQTACPVAGLVAALCARAQCAPDTAGHCQTTVPIICVSAATAVTVTQGGNDGFPGHGAHRDDNRCAHVLRSEAEQAKSMSKPGACMCPQQRTGRQGASLRYVVHDGALNHCCAAYRCCCCPSFLQGSTRCRLGASRECPSPTKLPASHVS